MNPQKKKARVEELEMIQRSFLCCSSYDCARLASGFIALEQASMGIKQQQRDLDSKWKTKGLQLRT